MATIQFSPREEVTPIWNDVLGGIIQNLSPGMWIYKKVDTTPPGQVRREFTATDWEPFEISLVPVPADAETTFMAAETPPTRTKEKPDMEPNTQDAGVDARQNEVQIAAARDEAVKAERLRAPENPGVTFAGQDETDKRREGMESALFPRANLTTRKGRIKAWINQKIEPWMVFSPKNKAAVAEATRQALAELKPRLWLERILGGKQQ